MDLVWLILAILGSFAVGIGFCIVIQWFIKREALSIDAKRKNGLSQQAKQELSGELMACMTEGSQMYGELVKSGKTPFEAGIDIAPKLAMKYPRVAMKFGGDIKKLVENFQGLEGN